jgi:hypothetical protein
MSAVRFLAAAILLNGFAASLLAAPVPPQKADDRELHVVCQGRVPRRDTADKTPVKVDRPGKEVTLVLGGNQDVAWDVTVTSSTRLVKVILIGLGKQTVSELPKTTEVFEAFADRQNRVSRAAIPAGAAESDPFFRPMIRQLHAMTGLEVTSFHASSGTPVVVDQVQADQQLRSDYPRPEPADGLPKLEFRALAPAATRAAGSNAATYAKFNLTGGPAADSRIELPTIGGQPSQRINALAVDPATNKGYALAGLRDVVEIDMDTKTTTPLPPIPNGPRNTPATPRGIAFDTKRDRVLVTTGIQLFTYSPKMGKWEELQPSQPGRRFGFGLAVVLTYQPATDSLYLLTEAAGRSGSPALHRLNADGTTLSVTPLSGPFLAGVLRGLPLFSQVQLAAADKALVLVANVASTDLIQRKRETETFIYLIDPETGKARLTWKHEEAAPIGRPRPPVPPPQNPAP